MIFFLLLIAFQLHFARGVFVELLISSNIARYSEFRSVSRVLTWINGNLEVVPCSRSDVFANNRVTVVEKRMLMKLLTSIEEDEKNSTGMLVIQIPIFYYKRIKKNVRVLLLQYHMKPLIRASLKAKNYLII